MPRFTGGETYFLSASAPATERVRVAPKIGRCVLFEHALYHTGAEVAAVDPDCKYVLRTDVMFASREETERETSPPPLHPAAPPPPPPPSVEALLQSLGLAEYRDAIDALGLLGSLDSFLAPGLPAIAAMLEEMDIPPHHVAALLAAAEAAVGESPAASAPPSFLQSAAT